MTTIERRRGGSEAQGKIVDSHLEREIVSLFGPQVLLPLTLGPLASASAGAAQVLQDVRLPIVEALAMHQAARRALLAAAQHSHGLVHIVNELAAVAEQAAARHAALDADAAPVVRHLHARFDARLSISKQIQ